MQDRVFRTVPIAVRKKRSAARFRVGLCQVPGGKGSPRLKECYKQNLTKFAWERYFLKCPQNVECLHSNPSII